MLVNFFSFMRFNHSVFQGLLDNLIDLTACCCSSHCAGKQVYAIEIFHLRNVHQQSAAALREVISQEGRV